MYGTQNICKAITNFNYIRRFEFKLFSNVVVIDYCGFVCPDEFVVGYGMDFNEYYRCLPFVGVLKEECYK